MYIFMQSVAKLGTHCSKTAVVT